jgi:hypothetical protein
MLNEVKDAKGRLAIQLLLRGVKIYFATMNMEGDSISEIPTFYDVDPTGVNTVKYTSFLNITKSYSAETVNVPVARIGLLVSGTKLRRHQLEEHLSIMVNYCDYCGARYTNAKNMRNHRASCKFGAAVH